MAPHSSTLAWKLPWTEEPGGLQSMGSQSQTRLSDFTFTFHFHALEKEMATHSSGRIQWENPRDGEPGGLPSVGSQRVGHDWSDLAAAAAAVRVDGRRDSFETSVTIFSRCKTTKTSWERIYVNWTCGGRGSASKPIRVFRKKPILKCFQLKIIFMLQWYFLEPFIALMLNHSNWHTNTLYLLS